MTHLCGCNYEINGLSEILSMSNGTLIVVFR